MCCARSLGACGKSRKGTPTIAEPWSDASRGAANGDTRLPPARRVLHVERDTFLAALYHATLEDAGFDVDWYPSPDAALVAAPPAAYDVCLLDANLPAARGRTTAGTVAELARGACVLILASELEAEIDTTGVLNLSKPFPPHALVQAVESAFLNRRRAA